MHFKTEKIQELLRIEGNVPPFRRTKARGPRYFAGPLSIRNNHIATRRTFAQDQLGCRDPEPLPPQSH